MRSMVLAAALGLSASAALGQPAPTALFASDEPLRLTLSGAIDRIGKSGSEAGTIAIAGGASETVRLEPRGITRRQRDVCQFPPIRVVVERPAAQSVFAGQRRLKLVTHCRNAESFQNHVLLEYAAYRIYNVLTPLSFRARLAQIDYQQADGRPIISRYGFFIEDIDDVARRNGMQAARLGERFPVSRLSPTDAARFAIFQYMIGNLDWAMQAGPPGDQCCHNSRPVGPQGAASEKIVPVPYDFDFSGLVNAPYATPPASVPVRDVRKRHYRGLCRHNAEARALFVEFRARAGQIRDAVSGVPSLDARVRGRALSYLDDFFRDIATDESAEAKVLKTCLG